MSYFKTFLPLVFFFAVASKSFAQESFVKGYIVKPSGDTLHGFINNFYDSKNITFRVIKNGKNIVFTPTEIKGFQINNQYYETKKIYVNYYKINISFPNLNFLEHGKFLEKVENSFSNRDTVFLKRIIKGKINLYEYISRTNDKGFYAEKGNRIVELPPIHFTFKKDTANGYGGFFADGHFNRLPNFSGTFTKQNNYLDSLTHILADDDDYYNFKLSTNNKPNLEGLSMIINEYNFKYDNNYKVQKNGRGPFRIYFGGHFGGVKPSLNKALENSTYNTISNSNYSIFALIPALRINRNMFYRIGFQSFTYHVMETDLRKLQIDEKHELKSFSLGLRYAGVTGVIRPYVGGSLTILNRKINKYPTGTMFPMLVEVGTIFSYRKLNLFLQGNIYPPIINKVVGFRLLSYSVGMFF